MRVTNINIGNSPAGGDLARLAADIFYDDRQGCSELLWFDVPDSFREVLSTSGDPWLAALLPLASKLGEPLEIDGPVDSVLYENPRELMEWWRYWFPEMSVVSVIPKSVLTKPKQLVDRTAQFFSGGVDSFFTLLRQSNNSYAAGVDDLLFGWGFDIPIADQHSFDRVKNVLAQAATDLDKNLVTFSSNIRETRFKVLPWGEIGHGNAMAAVALLFGGAYDRVLIPSTDGYRETGPWGSHATTDHYYSSADVRIVHEGAAFTRLEKVELVASSKTALSALRVCWRSQSDSNCGKCEKCLRTMIALELCGSLSNAKTFEHVTLDLGLVSKIYCPYTQTGSFRLYYKEMRDESRRQGRLDIAKSISSALFRSLCKQPLLYVTNRIGANRYLGPVGRPIDAALRRTVII